MFCVAAETVVTRLNLQLVTDNAELDGKTTSLTMLHAPMAVTIDDGAL